jgi:hypothetical protein
MKSYLMITLYGEGEAETVCLDMKAKNRILQSELDSNAEQVGSL